jgi:ankyrin repeat protein
VHKSRGLLTDRRVRFLLAQLHVRSLVGQRTKAKVVSALENLSKGPEALQEAYGEAILRIDNQPQGDRILAKNVLSWISYAQTPLTTGELCHALAVEPGDKELDLDDIPDIYEIVSVCAGLVTIDEESQIVRLVHYTTQDYLVSIREKWIHDAEYNIASTCFTYLCFDAFGSGSCTSDVEYEKRLEQYKFLEYCARHWDKHVAGVQEKISGLAMILLDNRNLIASATQIRTKASKKYSWVRCSHNFRENVTGLHLTASFGLLHLSKQLLFSGQEEKPTLADARDSCGQTPLMWAARSGQQDTVKLLLSTNSVDPNAKDESGLTPLILAAWDGHTDTVRQLLLSTNVDPHAKDDCEWTALGYAVSSGSRNTVEMLLQVGNFDPSETCSEGRALLAHAAGCGEYDIVDLLLGEAKFSTDDYCSALDLAELEGYEDIIKLLLSTDKVEFNAKEKEKLTPLLHAVWYGHWIAVDLLLSTDRVDPNAKDEMGLTPLMYAMFNGSEDIVKMLLSTDRVDPNAKDDEQGMTPLMVAVHRGYEDIVKLLLSTDRVDPNAKNKKGWTPLVVAVHEGYEGIVKLLLSTDRVDPNAKDDEQGVKPLMVAVHEGYEGIVELILSVMEVNLKIQDSSIQKLLTLAEAEGHKDIAELLESYSYGS